MSANDDYVLTAARLRKVLNYNQRTGAFTWAANGNNRVKGRLAGTARADGSRLIWIDGRPWSANRLAWLYVTDKWPQGQLTYADRDPSNLRWDNILPRMERFSKEPSAAYQRNLRARKRGNTPLPPAKATPAEAAAIARTAKLDTRAARMELAAAGGGETARRFVRLRRDADGTVVEE